VASYLTKPVKQSTLLDAIMTSLGRSACVEDHPGPAPAEAVPVAPQAAVLPAIPAKGAVLAKKIKPPRSPVAAVTAVSAKPETAAAGAEPGQRGFFGLRRAQPQRVALRGNESGFAGMISRALGGR
jgi:hypothetical protein